MSHFKDTINPGSGQARPNADVAQVQGALRLLVEPGSIVELRVPGTHRGTVSGYFNDFDRLASTCAKYSSTAPAIYITINPVNSDLLARAKLTERMKGMSKKRSLRSKTTVATVKSDKKNQNKANAISRQLRTME